MSYAAIVRKHFPNFEYTKCYGGSENGRVKYWLPRGIVDSGPAWAAMVAELRQQGIKHVRFLHSNRTRGSGLALYTRNTRIPS